MDEYIRPQNRHLTHDSESQRKRSIKHGYYCANFKWRGPQKEE